MTSIPAFVASVATRESAAELDFAADAHLSRRDGLDLTALVDMHDRPSRFPALFVTEGTQAVFTDRSARGPGSSGSLALGVCGVF
jgi:hypothetical protein